MSICTLFSFLFAAAVGQNIDRDARQVAKAESAQPDAVSGERVESGEDSRTRRNADPILQGPVYELRWSVAAGGGSAVMSGGAFNASGTVGQPTGGETTGGTFASSSGSWAQHVAGVCVDADGDGDIDLVDFEMLAPCFAGPGSPAAAECPPGVDADCDNDADVDLRDFAFFTRNLLMTERSK